MFACAAAVAPAAYAFQLDGTTTGADLAVASSGLPSNAAPGQAFAVTFSVKNDGPESATDVGVTVAVPSQFDVDFGEVPPGVTCPSYPANGADGGTIQCQFGSIAAGATKSFVWHFMAARAGSAQTTASVSATSADPDSADNTAAATTVVRLSNADLRLTSMSTPSVTVGGYVTYLLEVTNLGPDPILGGTLVDALPASLGTTTEFPILSAGPNVAFCQTVFVGAGAPYSQCLSSALTCKIERALTPPLTLSCTVNAIAPGQTGFVRITAKTTAPGSITNTATLTGSEINEPSTANNVSSATTEVRALTPTVTCPPNVSTTTDPGVATAIVDPGVATASGGTQPVNVTNSGVPAGNAFPIGSTAIVWTATDAAGQSAACTQTVTVVDDEAPTIACAAPDGEWHAMNVSLNCAASDAGIGLADPADSSFALSTTVAAGQTAPNAATGSRAVCDQEGNCATAGPIAGNKIDREAPAIAVAAPAEDSVYVLGSTASSSFACDDAGGSGVDACTGAAQISTDTPGAHSFTVSASDEVGNSAARTVTYSVTYAASCDGRPSRAVAEPINADGTSVFKQGRTVPIKFRVCDASGVAIAAPGVVTAFALLRTTTGTVVSVVNEEPQSTTPDTSFRWDSVDRQWVFNLRTTNLAAQKTYTYRIALNDGTTIEFTFGLR
jgi:uncharacterized repeat protein (TIGR01451 family)